MRRDILAEDAPPANVTARYERMLTRQWSQGPLACVRSKMKHMIRLLALGLLALLPRCVCTERSAICFTTPRPLFIVGEGSSYRRPYHL